MSDDPRTRAPSPEQDAVNEHRDEGEGPFGSDMTHLLGGTRAPEEHTPPQGHAYNTGTEPQSGESLAPNDPRSRWKREGVTPSGHGQGHSTDTP